MTLPTIPPALRASVKGSSLRARLAVSQLARRGRPAGSGPPVNLSFESSYRFLNSGVIWGRSSHALHDPWQPALSPVAVSTRSHGQ